MGIVSLDKVQLSELQQFREEALAEFRKIDPTLEHKIAGTGLSDGGMEKISEMLETHFRSMEKAAENMPDELEIAPSAARLDTVGENISNMETTASFYLFMDYFRPRGGWTLSAKKREMTAEYNRIMDGRAWMAVVCLKMARSYLPLVARARKHI